MNQTIKDAEKLAKRILTHKIRKSLGEYYIFWSTYVVIEGLLYSISSIHSLLIYFLIPLLLIYIAYTSVIFHKAYSKREFLHSSKNRLRDILFTALMLSIIGLWVYTLITLNDFSYYIVSDAVYTTIISIFIYDTARDTGKVRYYDYVAIITFIISMLLGPFNSLFYYLYFFFWIYAGVKSIVESYEGSEDEQ
ncbi:hypothetical protein [Sulfurisphaera ohwakuensis]|uniref:Uncharacterized protein n=1 Tax=Sulfurisphaera ohwakuensis TaxID=69656 RepID=A0A650CK42_SULOH|nr:hypothetical protein [Sulfurisphaera ohwakuensis]MBB5254319.1 hypothetical protein [Sulfurisphaera ohwakuensis]QGR18210.1 hypothetical protein D1869_14195 [Sulfurisphaera ohwakuensis]